MIEDAPAVNGVAPTTNQVAPEPVKDAPAPSLELSMDEYNIILMALQTGKYSFAEFEQGVRPLIFKIYRHANQAQGEVVAQG